ncbi:MAG: hypothetical protein WBO54_06130 [Thermoanaerobaculia bacterium]
MSNRTFRYPGQRHAQGLPGKEYSLPADHQVVPIALTLLSFFLMLYVFQWQDKTVYYMWIEGESSLTEHLTIVFAVVGIMLAIRQFKRRDRVPSRFFGAIMVLFMTGFLYIAMEEASWGQHLFKWETPDWISEHNNQQETNLHNLGLFGTQLDRLPKAILGAIVVITGVLWPLYLRLKGSPNLPNWFKVYWPSSANTTTAWCFFTIWIIGRSFVISDANRLDNLNLHSSEIRELLITYFLVVYVRAFKRYPAD